MADPVARLNTESARATSIRKTIAWWGGITVALFVLGVATHWLLPLLGASLSAFLGIAAAALWIVVFLLNGLGEWVHRKLHR